MGTSLTASLQHLQRAASSFQCRAEDTPIRPARLGAQLLAAAAKTQRGLTASKAERAEVDGLARALERVNPNPKSLSAPEINGRWKLVYTTSESILGSKRPPFLRPIGPIYQTIGACYRTARFSFDASGSGR